MTLVVDIMRLVSATVEQKRNGSCPWVVTVTFTNDAEGEKAAHRFHQEVEDRHLFATNPDAWRAKYGYDGPPVAADAVSAVE